jgi:hypothetical protein
VEWCSRVHFTQSELHKLHHGFHHPANDKLLNLIRRARPEEIDNDTSSILREIVTACKTCQRYGPKPARFKVSMPNMDYMVFGDDLSIDLMFIESIAILHIIDTATRFSGAIYLNNEYGQSVEGVWTAFMKAWCSFYTGYPTRLRTDAGSIFVSPRWKELTDLAGISMRVSGTEAHTSLGRGERC